MLHRDMNIPELPLECVRRVDRVRSSRMEYKIRRTDRLVNGMRNGETQLA
jgi:hypothetical protein